MAEYGLTSTGPNIKRLDVIIDEIHDDLSEKWGVNTRQNPQSFLNVLITDFSDKIAELWEFGEDIYYSQYPMSADGVSLDNAVQFGGITREPAAKSYYPIHCTGIDGTVLDSATKIASLTNPPTNLGISEPKTITRAAFNKAVIKLSAVTIGSPYTVTIDGTVYRCESSSTDPETILNAISSAITASGFTKTVDAENLTLMIECDDITSNHAMALSSNLTTETVTTIINFGTEEKGDILLPNGTITRIVSAAAGLQSVTNLCPYIKGNAEQSDTELRQDYADKCFSRSTNMLESIRSAILKNVQGVDGVAAYQNDTNVTDSAGRPPHSIEVVVAGGDDSSIAQEILDNKAGGISTYGSQSITLAGKNGEDIIIRFNRPEPVYVWYNVVLTLDPETDLPSNYVSLIRNVITENMDNLGLGSDVKPQQFIKELFDACPGFSYADVMLETSGSGEESARPQSYTKRSVQIAARERAVTTEDMITVSTVNVS